MRRHLTASIFIAGLAPESWAYAPNMGVSGPLLDLTPMLTIPLVALALRLRAGCMNLVGTRMLAPQTKSWPLMLPYCEQGYRLNAGPALTVCG